MFPIPLRKRPRPPIVPDIRPRTTRDATCYVADVYDGRWRYSPFAAGDVVIFNCLTVHKGVPNRSASLRLSVDMRYQPAREPVCEDWLHPYRRAVDWPTFYKDWPDDTYQYYWTKMDLNVVPFDPSYYADREAQAFDLAARGDRRATASLQRIARTSPDPATRRRAQAALADLVADTAAD